MLLIPAFNYFASNLDKFYQIFKLLYNYFLGKSSRLKVLYKIGVLKIFTKLTGKHPYRSLYYNKVAGLRPGNLLKETLRCNFFPMNCVKFLRIPFSIKYLWWLLLSRETSHSKR